MAVHSLAKVAVAMGRIRSSAVAVLVLALAAVAAAVAVAASDVHATQQESIRDHQVRKYLTPFQQNAC